MEKEYNKSITITDSAFIKWCSTFDIIIFKIHHVITWEEWDNGIGVYIFVKTNSELKKIENRKSQIESQYKRFLEANNYPFNKFPNVNFEFDSDENVINHYEGNYFYRLR